MKKKAKIEALRTLLNAPIDWPVYTYMKMKAHGISPKKYMKKSVLKYVENKLTK